jgi:Dihydrodipicolinate synthetase family
MTNLVRPATWLAGYIADLPTPFDDNDRIDLTAFAQLCERQIEAGASAIVVGETAGEASTLTPAEHDAIVHTAIEIARVIIVMKQITIFLIAAKEAGHLASPPSAQLASSWPEDADDGIGNRGSPLLSLIAAA